MELHLAVALLVALPIAGGVGLLLLLRRTEQPLKDLQDLLNHLATRDFRPLSDEALNQTTRLARPAFNSYNVLVSRLQDLEAEHRDRERLLERRVREATEALLAQSRELSRAERLAAVGVVSAGLAHELRNPLAGIQLACSKLYQKLGNSDQAKRIAAVISELKRINHLLTERVDAARHAPEPSVPTNIATTVSELLALLRYQVPADFTLEAFVDEDVQCTLPAAGLRRALLNLVLNAVQIQGDRGRVEVSGSRETDWVVIRVSDDGPGFPEEMLHAGIRPFATGRAGGTGLGLAMVRRFVRDLDGDFTLENRSPHGAQVTLRLPCRAASQPGVVTDA
jgi:two-component system NtrC family sensor kinase